MRNARSKFYGALSWILISVVTLSALSPATAQSFGDGTDASVYDRNQSATLLNANPLLSDPNAPVDSLSKKKERREKKPLSSYYFNDSTKRQNVFSWRHNPFNNNIEIIPIDTALYNFQKDYIFLRRENVGSAYLGQLGGASIPLNYFNRPHFQSFSFLDAYADYLFTPENVPFYNGKRPFTQLSFFMSGQTKRAEEQLRVIHAQNISPSSNINLNYRNNGTRGMYTNQRSKDKNLSLSFSHSGRKYSIHGGYLYNMGDIYENGGLTDDGQVLDTLIDLPQNLEMNLTDARNRFKGNTFYFTQSYGLPFRKLEEDETLANVTTLFVGNSFEYTGFKKIYTDTKDKTAEDYYANWFINPNQSNDSIKENRMDLKFFAQFQPYNREGILGTIDGGLGYTMNSYYNFNLNQYLAPQEKNVKKNSVYVYANAEGAFKEYVKWNGSFQYYPIGYRSQDLSVDGNLTVSAKIRQHPVSLSFNVHYRLEKPDYWSEHYTSNHFMWDNSFNKENELRLGARLSIPSIGTEVGFTQSITDNKVYYNRLSIPVQYQRALSVTGIYLQKDFRAGGLHLNNRVLLQWSSAQEVAPVPLVSANATYYYEFNVVKDVLRLQIGLDGYYNTEYYGFGYNPALMRFYNQRDTKTGNYIWLDGFISGKWKRVRFLVKFQHLNYNLFGQRNYFQIAHYPLNRRMLKLGVSWNFYD